MLYSCVLHIATTYVVQEGGVEVGQWEENDGSAEVKIIDNELDKKTPLAPIEPGQPIMGEPGYQWTDPKIPEGEIAQWKVSGRVINILTLAGAGPGEITFSYNKIKTVIKAGANGSFAGSVPQLKRGSYTLSANFPGYSDSWIDFRKTGDFSKIPYQERLQKRNGVPQWAAINRTHYDMEIGLIPERMTRQQEADYYKHMREVTSGTGNDEEIS